MTDMRFLEEIAEIFLSKYAGEHEEVTIVFPNRRAGLFFQKYLAERIDKPIWSPRITGIEDFIIGLSTQKTADKLELILELYKVFSKLNKSKESFDRFYYWGNIMLQDFDEIDKFMVDPELLFKNLAHVKNIENSLDYLEDEQKNLIAGFWKSFGDKLSRHQTGFLELWDNLFQTYKLFKNSLYEKGIAYTGMIYRDVEEELQMGQSSPQIGKVIFAGFNALSKSEEAIITWFVKEGKGEVFWDADDYYLSDNKQEAGKYLREMKYGNVVLGKTFRGSYGNAFIDTDKRIEVISVASDVGQAQQASEILSQIGEELNENTAVVLPDSELLFPVLHALPGKLEKLNITMGYPLATSSVYGFLDALLDLQIRAEEKNAYHFRPVLTVLRHPVFSQLKDESARELEKQIMQHNTIWISKKKIENKSRVLDMIFCKPKSLTTYLLDILRFLAEHNEDLVEREFYFHFYTLINRLNEFVLTNQLELSSTAFQKIFRQIVQNERLPFEGEPLLGLQVMGILETRNLDFDNVIVLSMNETLMPPAPKNNSFIPFSIRKVFDLPVVDQQDAMYAYIFYSLVQRAKRVSFIYNSTEETGKSGEVSRFVRQLQYESRLKISHKTITTDVNIQDPNVITIPMNDHIRDRLYRFTSIRGYQKRFTPTALSTYLDCRLRFYFKYVLELYEQEEVSEDVDPMVFGNILHHVMEQLYLKFDQDGSRIVKKEDIVMLRDRIDEVIENQFARQFGQEEENFDFEGHNVLVREIIKKMVLKVLQIDMQNTPFEILGVEADDKKGYILNTPIDSNGRSFNVGMKGIIDRIEHKEGVIRIVDYKTGQDEKNFTDIASLFDRDFKKRNKAIFQTFFYGLLYLNSAEDSIDIRIQAALFNIRDIFRSDFSPLIQCNKTDVHDIKMYIGEFEERLKSLLTEILDPDLAFDQTSDNKKCEYCPYIGICNR